MRVALVIVLGVLVLSRSGHGQAPTTPMPISAGGQISEEAINLFLGYQLDEVTKARQGDRLLGTAHITGAITVELSPHLDAVLLDVRLRCVSRRLKQPAGDTAGLGRMNIEATIDARKRIVVDVDGLATEPATADCQALLKQLESLDQPWARSLLQAAERLASVQTEKRVEQQLDARIDQAIENATSRLRNQPWLPLDKATALVEMLAFCSTSGHARAQVFCAPEDDMPAPRHVRELDPSYDVHILLHEAMAAAVSSKWCSGKRIQDDEVLNHVRRMRGRAPWALWVHARRPRWAVTLAAERPVAIRFDKNKMHLRLRIDSTEYDGDVLETPIKVEVVMQPEQTSEGHCLRRFAGPVITFLDGEHDPRREEIGAMLQQKLDALFPPEIYFDGLKTPLSGAWSKFLQFKIADFSAEEGWFSLAFQLNEGNSAIASEAILEARR